MPWAERLTARLQNAINLTTECPIWRNADGTITLELSEEALAALHRTYNPERRFSFMPTPADGDGAQPSTFQVDAKTTQGYRPVQL